MSTPRLTGPLLRIVRALIQHEPFKSIASRRLRATYGLEQLFELSADAREYFDAEPRPIVGAADHGWEHAGHEPPGTSGSERLRTGYASGDIDPIEVVRRLRARVDEREFGVTRHSPFVIADWSGAEKEAEKSRERWADGEPKSPLDGVPVPVKDHHRQAGLPTSCGTPYFQDYTGPAEVDSEVVGRLREAGALLVGKTHTTEWGLQPTGFNPHFPMPRNAYSGDHAAGGSSTGTATAIATGISPVGLGSDGGGSIRIPAALNGLFGIKPTYQRLSREGDYWKQGTVSHNGPLGHSTADLVDFLSVTGAQPDSNDLATQLAPEGDPTDAWREALGRGVDGAKIGLWSWAFETAKPEIAEPCRQAARALEEAGAELVDVDIPWSEYHQAIGTLTIGIEAVGLLHEVFQMLGDHTGDDVLLMLTGLSTVTAGEYMLARRTRATLRRTLARSFQDVDLILAPSTNMTAPHFPAIDDGRAIFDEDAILQLCRFSFMGNITGVPAGSAPVGMVDDLPVGLQIIGDAWDEASVFAAMAELERLGVTDLPEPPGPSPVWD